MQGYTTGLPLDPDGSLSNDSDQLVATQKAVKTYVDSRIAEYWFTVSAISEHIGHHGSDQ